MKSIYYAHHLYKYNTQIEKYELGLIRKALPGYKIINPNGDLKHEDLTDEKKIMGKCLKTVSECNTLVFSSISGVIGQGVYDEAMKALDLGKDVYYIYNNQVRPCAHIEFKIINESQRIYAIVKDIAYYKD